MCHWTRLIAGEQRGYWYAGGRVPSRIRWARELVQNCGDEAGQDLIHDLVGTSVVSQESVAACFALAELAGDRPFQALCMAASLGGDTDTIAAMLGAMLGACHGLAVWPKALLARIRTVNQLAPEELVDDLLVLRGSKDRDINSAT